MYASAGNESTSIFFCDKSSLFVCVMNGLLFYDLFIFFRFVLICFDLFFVLILSFGFSFQF